MRTPSVITMCFPSTRNFDFADRGAPEQLFARRKVLADGVPDALQRLLSRRSQEESMSEERTRGSSRDSASPADAGTAPPVG